MVLSPAGPTTAPGGSVAVAAWVAEAGVEALVAPLLEPDLLWPLPEPDPPWPPPELDPPWLAPWPPDPPPALFAWSLVLAAALAAVVAAGADPVPDVSLTLRKSTPVELAVESSW